jgi:hypothetical protein
LSGELVSPEVVKCAPPGTREHWLPWKAAGAYVIWRYRDEYGGWVYAAREAGATPLGFIGYCMLRSCLYSIGLAERDLKEIET